MKEIVLSMNTGYWFVVVLAVITLEPRQSLGLRCSPGAGELRETTMLFKVGTADIIR